MLNDIYNRRVLQLAADIPRQGRLSHPQATAKAHSKLCGSTVTIDLSVADGKVSDFAHDVRACALGQASSSLMARHVIGATPEELRELRETMIEQEISDKREDYQLAAEASDIIRRSGRLLRLPKVK